jgi:hypothetical protein
MPGSAVGGKGLRWNSQGITTPEVVGKLAMYTIHGNRTWLQGTKNIDFLADLAGRFMEDRKALPRPNTTKLDSSPCCYHHHGEGESCYRAKRV